MSGIVQDAATGSNIEMEFASVLQFLQEQKELGLHQNDKGVVLCKLNWSDFCSRLPFSWSVKCPNVCPLCVKQLSSRFSLSRHYVDVHHREEKRLPQQASCQLCHKKLYNRSTLKRHLLTVHGHQTVSAVDSSSPSSCADTGQPLALGRTSPLHEYDVSTASQEYNYYLPTLSDSDDECPYDMTAVSPCDENVSSTARDTVIMDVPSSKLSVCDQRFQVTDAVPKEAVGSSVKGVAGNAASRRSINVPAVHATSVSFNNNGPTSSCNNSNSARSVVDTVCPLCPDRSEGVHGLARHVLKRHCCHCPRCHVQLPVLLLSRHLDAHRQQLAFWCPVCGEREGERVDMLRHICQRHEFIAEGSQFRCSTCGHVRSENLTTHCLQHARQQALTAHSHRDAELLPAEVIGVRLGRVLLDGVGHTSSTRDGGRSSRSSRKRWRLDPFEAGAVVVVRDSPGQALSFLPETGAAVSPPATDIGAITAEESAGALVSTPVSDTDVITAEDGVISVWTPPAENGYSSGLADDIASVVSDSLLSHWSTSQTTVGGVGGSLGDVAPLRAQKLRSLSLDLDSLQNPVLESILFPSISPPSIGTSGRPAAADDELLDPVSVSTLDSAADSPPGGSIGDVIEPALVRDNRSRAEFCPAAAGSRTAERQLAGCVSVQLVDTMDRPSWPVNAAQLLSESLCTVCAGPVPGGQQLADHLLRHGRIPLYFCSSCQHTFSQPSTVTAAHSCRLDSCHRTQLLCLLCGLQVSGEDVTVHWMLHSMGDPLCHQLLYPDASIAASSHQQGVSNGKAAHPTSGSGDCTSTCCGSESSKREPSVGVIASDWRASDFSTVSEDEFDPVVAVDSRVCSATGSVGDHRNSTLPARVHVDASAGGVRESSTLGELPADQRQGNVITGTRRLEDQVKVTGAGSGAGKRRVIDEASLLEAGRACLFKHIKIAHLESNSSGSSVSSQCVQYVNGCIMSEARNSRVTDLLVSPKRDSCGGCTVDFQLSGQAVEWQLRGSGEAVKCQLHGSGEAVGGAVDHQLRGSGEAVDCQLRGSGDAVDCQLRGSGEAVDCRLRGSGEAVDCRLRESGEAVDCQLRGSGEAATLQCPACPAAARRRRFFSPCQLRRHCLWRHGTRRGPHRCRRCPSRFFLLGQLRAHLCCDSTPSGRLCPRCCTPLQSRQLRSSSGRLSGPVLVCDSCLLPASSPNGRPWGDVAPDGRTGGDVAPNGRTGGDVAPDGRPRGDGGVDQVVCAWPACCARCDVPVGRDTAAVRWSDDAPPCRLCVPCARHWLLLRPADAPLLWFPHTDVSCPPPAALWCPSCCQPLASLHQLRTHNLLHHAELE